MSNVLMAALRAARRRGDIPLMTDTEYFNPGESADETLSPSLLSPVRGVTTMLQTRNHDVKALINVMDTVNFEINASASGHIPGVTAADMSRWQSYIGQIRSYAAWVVDTPSPLDMPKTSDMVMDIPDSQVFAPTENQTANDVVRMLLLERTELALSQSSGMSSGLITYDYDRLLSVLAKCDSRLSLSEDNVPTDVPQSYPVIGAGTQSMNVT